MISSQTTANAFSAADNDKLLAARREAWTCFFRNDAAAMLTMFPEETVAGNPGKRNWETQMDMIRSAQIFAKEGNKLVDLHFSNTTIRRYGKTVVLYSNYSVTTAKNGDKTTLTGRCMELFVFRNGQWVNPGWEIEAYPKGSR